MLPNVAPDSLDDRSPDDLPAPSWRAALLASIALSLLFLVVYNLSGWFTSLRSDVGTWRYDWEQHIWFEPWFIIPYMSIDLFFVAAPFLCRRTSELRIFSARITLAILLAGVGFAVMPLQLAVERPHVEGWLGTIFNPFVAIDRPYNLCPSLHIALRTILADIYARHTRGLASIASQVWFSLIGFSTLFTYQHHVVDVVGGFILAIICFYLAHEAPWRRTVLPNRRVAMYYAIGCSLLLIIAVYGSGWWRWFAWPAASVGLIVLAYLGLGPGVYRKHRGRLPLAARLLMGPMIWGQAASWHYYRRRCEPWNQVAPQVWIGRQLTDSEAQLAIQAGVSAVVDLTAEFSAPATFHSLPRLDLPILDLTAPNSAQLQLAVDFIARHVNRGVVYVHCKVGYSRSAAVVGAYLLASGAASSVDDAIAQLRRVRPTIVIRPEAQAALHAFANVRNA